MKKFTFFIFFFCFSFFLASCSPNIEETLSNPISSNKDTFSEEVSKDIFDEKASRYKTVTAEKDKIILASDYEPIMNLCNDFCNELIRTADAKSKDKPDFTPYITNPMLLKYSEYCVEKYPQGIDKENTRYIYHYINDDTQEYVMVKGGLFSGGSNSFSGYGEVDFLIKNVNGRCVIVDWALIYKNCPDITLTDSEGNRYRKDFSAENNLDFWDSPKKYSGLMGEISATP